MENLDSPRHPNLSRTKRGLGFENSFISHHGPSVDGYGWPKFAHHRRLRQSLLTSFSDAVVFGMVAGIRTLLRSRMR
jgi:hypothetical protein